MHLNETNTTKRINHVAQAVAHCPHLLGLFRPTADPHYMRLDFLQRRRDRPITPLMKMSDSDMLKPSFFLRQLADAPRGESTGAKEERESLSTKTATGKNGKQAIMQSTHASGGEG